MQNYNEWMNSITDFFENQNSFGLSWDEVSDLIEKSGCNKRVATGNCQHPRCERSHHLAITASQGNAMTLDDMLRVQDFIREKSCDSMRQSGVCFHPSCRKNQRYVDWIQEQIDDAESKEAI